MTQTPHKGAELLALLTRCLEREYNGFGPGNQSKLYYDIAGTIHALTASESPTVDRASLIAKVSELPERLDGVNFSQGWRNGFSEAIGHVLAILRSQP